MMTHLLSWNNQRRSYYYWFAIFFLALNPANFLWWPQLTNHPMVPFRDFVYYIFDFLSISGHPIGSMAATAFTPGILAIPAMIIINHLIGFIPERQTSKRLLSVTAQPAFWTDIAIGVLLSANSLHSIKQALALEEYRFIFTLMSFVSFFLASWTYWPSLFPVRAYCRLLRRLKKEPCADFCWFCLSNTEYRFSVFSRFCNKGSLGLPLLDRQDLALLKKKKKIHLRESDFQNFVIIADRSKPFSNTLLHQVAKILRIPHARILVCYTGVSPLNQSITSLEKLLKTNENISFTEFDATSDRLHLNLQQILYSPGPLFSDGRRVPLHYLHDDMLIQTYMHIESGPKLCLVFLQKICCQLDVAPGIYALFDFIDLQYRIQLAASQPWLKKGQSNITTIFDTWAEDNSYCVGNIGKMATLLHDVIIAGSKSSPAAALSTERIFSDIFTSDDLKLIRKYLFNYEIEYDRPGYQTIIYLTKNLRNVLRGHGYFDVADAEALFELIMKLAMLNTLMLSANSVTLTAGPPDQQLGQGLRRVDMQIASEPPICPIPFLVASPDGEILCFNNYRVRNRKVRKTQIEYINYLNGTITLTDFQNVPASPQNTHG